LAVLRPLVPLHQHGFLCLFTCRLRTGLHLKSPLIATACPVLLELSASAAKPHAITDAIRLAAFPRDESATTIERARGTCPDLFRSPTTKEANGSPDPGTEQGPAAFEVVPCVSIPGGIMNPKALLLGSCLWLAALGCLSARSGTAEAGDEPQAKVREFHFTYEATVTGLHGLRRFAG